MNKFYDIINIAIGDNTDAMGRSDISVTMNVYTHIGFDDAKAVSQKMFKVV